MIDETTSKSAIFLQKHKLHLLISLNFRIRKLQVIILLPSLGKVDI